MEQPARSPTSDGFLSVVYPTCGRPELLSRSIGALLASGSLPEEIVVVDQSGTDLTQRALAALARPERIVHVPSGERGLSRARNSGIAACRGAVIGFLDDDCIPARDWVSAARRAIERMPRSAVWIGALVHDEAEFHGTPGPERRMTLSGTHDPWRIGPTGGNCLYRRTVFERVGLFDPLLGQGSTFPGAEDGDMIYRTMKHGLPVSFTSSIRCFHVGWRNEIEQIANGYNYGLGVGAMMAKFAAQGDYYPLTVIFGRRFLTNYVALPFHALVGPRAKLRLRWRWAQGITHGFIGWRRMNRRP